MERAKKYPTILLYSILHIRLNEFFMLFRMLTLLILQEILQEPNSTFWDWSYLSVKNKKNGMAENISNSNVLKF